MNKIFVFVKKTSTYTIDYLKSLTISTITPIDLLVIVLIVIGVSLTIAIMASVILWPIWIAWASNTLFGTTLPYSFPTWLSIVIVTWFIAVLLRK
ncbi:MAG: hypothetical protein ACXW2E_01505 [Nitrososphaeraceae archaeon]